MDALMANQAGDIHALAQYIQQYVDVNWSVVFEQNQQEMVELYPKIGDTVYGIYGKRLFQAMHEQLKAVGLKATPRLPGNLMISREWGEEDDRQRWMWSKITATDGTALGTIAVVFYHDHFQIRIPRAFKIVALEAVSKGAVVEAISRLAPEFKDAMEMKAEIAQYMAQQ